MLGVVPVPVPGTDIKIGTGTERRKELIYNNEWERVTGTLRDKYMN